MTTATPLTGGRNIAMKVPAHLYDDTVRFYRDVCGLPPADAPSTCFVFGANRLWIDRVQGQGLPEVWLQLVTDDTAAAATHLETAGVRRYEGAERLPDGFDGFWITNPASVVHLVCAPKHS